MPVRLDSGVGNVETYIYGTLPSQVPIWKMVDESTAELVSEISGSWRTSVIGVVKAKTKRILRKLLLLLFPSCRERMMVFALLDHSKRFLRRQSPLWPPHLRRLLSDRATRDTDKAEVQPVSKLENLHSCVLSREPVEQA